MLFQNLRVDLAIPAAQPLFVGDGVRYTGSLEEMHGLYRITAVNPASRLVLSRKGVTILSNVRPESVERVPDGVCVRCDSALIWHRAVVFDDFDPNHGLDCADCANSTNWYR